MNKQKTIIVGIILASSLSGCAIRNVDHKWCPPEEPVSEQITLSADALFKFDKSSSNDMLPQGKASLNNLANQLSNNYVSINSMHVTGHTDRLGKADYNYALGLRRAETVKGYLETHGVNAPITVSSAGETQPVTTDCQGIHSSAALILCLQPDRRVVVDLTGIKKVKKGRALGGPSH